MSKLDNHHWPTPSFLLLFPSIHKKHLGLMTHPPRPLNGRLHDFWDKPVQDLVVLDAPQLTEADQERHTLYCLVLIALVAHYWNGNKRGASGVYPWRKRQSKPAGGYLGGDYLGHNIGCIAVDGRGEIIDFDFNHNDILNSSVEHAESRLVRRVFSLTQIYDDWATRSPGDPSRSASYSNLLSDVTIYTSLESCSQCSGIMALGSVKEVVFLHRDPGQNSIGNILRNLSQVGGRYRAPLPIPADVLGMDCFAQLDEAYSAFSKGVASRPFHIAEDGSKDTSASITSFLCTDAAMEVFLGGLERFRAMTQPVYPDHKPKGSDGQVIARCLSNAEVLAHTRRFFDYATTCARRGTPHQL